MNEEINVIADEYIDKFVASDLSLIKINDETYSRTVLRETLFSRIRERGISNISAYIFMNALYLEKV